MPRGISNVPLGTSYRVEVAEKGKNDLANRPRGASKQVGSTKKVGELTAKGKNDLTQGAQGHFFYGAAIFFDGAAVIFYGLAIFFYGPAMIFYSPAIFFDGRGILFLPAKIIRDPRGPFSNRPPAIGSTAAVYRGYHRSIRPGDEGFFANSPGAARYTFAINGGSCLYNQMKLTPLARRVRPPRSLQSSARSRGRHRPRSRPRRCARGCCASRRMPFPPPGVRTRWPDR